MDHVFSDIIACLYQQSRLQVYLDAFGGDPVVSAEIGAEPASNVLDNFPDQQTCRQVFITH